MPALGCEINQLLRIGHDVEEFLGRPRGPCEPARPGGQRAGGPGGPQFAGDRYACRIVGKVVARDPWQKMPHVAEPRIAHRAAEPGRSIHPVAHADHDLPRGGMGAEEAPPLHPVGDRHAREVEHRGTEIEQGDEVARDTRGCTTARELGRRRESRRHVHDERHAQTVLGERSLPVRNAFAVVAPEDHDRVVGKSIGREFLEDPSHVTVEGGGEVEPTGERRTHGRRVGIPGWHADGGRIGPAVRRAFFAHLSRLFP